MSSNDGIGAHSASESRSDSTMIRTPSSIACDASARTRSSASCSASPPPATRYRPEMTWPRNSGRSPSSSMWMSLASSSLSMIGNGRSIWTHDSGVGSSRFASAPIVRGQRGDQLLPDRVERRVGDLREHLREVVEQHARAIGQHGDRRVGAHRAERLPAGARHRRDEESELLVGVAERLLAPDDGRVGRRRGARGRGGRRDGRGPASFHSAYGCSAASAALISSSSTMRPCSVSTRKILPGCSLPFLTTRAGSTSTTPVSLAMITRSSSVTQKRLGRRPLRSSTAPMTVPSVNAIDAGPSHGSMSDAWYR